VWILSRAQILRGAASGVLAAAVWAVQQPIDKRIFGCRFDDVEMLGRAVSRDDDYYAPGLAIHLLNGALFGGAYAVVAPSLPGPDALKGPLAAFAENTLLWPLVGLIDRFHPAREMLEPLAGNRRAFSQASWRHVLFGAVLGELERRLRPPAEEAAGPVIETVYSSNGHGTLGDATLGLLSMDVRPGDSPN
jgi:hypothetical protein